MTDSAVRISRTDEEVQFADNGTIVEQIRVTFRVGTHGPFVKRFAKEGFDPIRARTELERFAGDLRTLHGE